jgi:hypothetical protein
MEDVALREINEISGNSSTFGSRTVRICVRATV